MLNSFPNHFSYLFENKNVQTVNKRKSITKSKEEAPKSISKKKKANELMGEKDLKKEESYGQESVPFNAEKQNSSDQKNGAFNSMILQENSYPYSPKLQDERTSYCIESKMELDTIPMNTYEQNYDKFQLQKKYSFIQQEEMEEFDSFDENNPKKKLNNTDNRNNFEGNQSQQLISTPHINSEQKINKERKEEVLATNPHNINSKIKISNGSSQNQVFYQPQPASEMIFWRRANQLQTKFQTKLREQSDCNQIMLKGDLCLEVNEQDYNSFLSYVPLSAYKRISNVKKYREGKIELQLITDVKVCQDIHYPKNEEEQIQQPSNQSSSSIEAQVKDYQTKIEQQKQAYAQIKQQSSSIFDNLKEHVNIKKQQFLNKIDFERKYIFGVEFQLDQEEGISSIHKVYYSKEFLSIMGLVGKDQALLEAYLLRNGVIDLYECLGLYNKKKEKKGDLISQYLQPLTESQQNLKTLDNLQVSVSINHRIINLSEEFIQMFADIGLQNISKEYFVLFELDIPYDQIKQIENERKNLEKNGIPNFFTSNQISNHLLSKYYPISHIQSSSSA